MAAQLCLVKKKNTKSPVWNHFGLRADDKGLPIAEDEDKPVCRKCFRTVPAKTGNTTNLIAHLRDNHPDLYSEISPIILQNKKQGESSSQPTLREVIEKKAAYHRNSKEAHELNDAVTLFLAKDMLPLSTVDRSGFRQLVTKLNPK